jgi:hypothetical protein
MLGKEEAITETFTDYTQAFQTLDPCAALPYFHVPCMFIRHRECVSSQLLPMLKHF